MKQRNRQILLHKQMDVLKRRKAMRQVSAKERVRKPIAKAAVKTTKHNPMPGPF